MKRGKGRKENRGVGEIQYAEKKETVIMRMMIIMMTLCTHGS